MRNIAFLHERLSAAGLPVVGVDSDGKLSWNSTPSSAELLRAAGIVSAFNGAEFDYQESRRKAYPPITDQLDTITKSLAFMAAKGIDIGPDGLSQVQQVEAIKSQFPKP